MRLFRYDCSGTWYKGNTHIHSQASDGGQTFPDLANMYDGAGYDFLCRTDHWVCSDTAADTAIYPLLWLDGVELHGTDDRGSFYHIACLGKFTGITEKMGLIKALQMVREQGGITILAHPFWTGNSLEDALRWNFDGVEGYNHVCHWLNGKSNGRVHWQAMLAHHPNTLMLAVDDAHVRPEHPGWNGGWIVVNSGEFSSVALYRAIRAGNFYSSCGPDFKKIECTDQTVRIKTSPIQFARLVGPAYNGLRLGDFSGKTFTSCEFQIPPDWPYAYLEIEDRRGRRAWTNALFI